MTLRVPELLPSSAYTFQQLRYLFQNLGLQQGVMGATDLKASQRGAGANMSVDVLAGNAWVKGTSVAAQGNYHEYSDATTNVATFGAAHATLPRMDQVIMAIQDGSVAGSSNTPVFAIIQGTATSGAQCTNFAGSGYRAGAVSDATIRSTYPNFIRICDVGVPATVTTIINSYIVDRRPWAQGGYVQCVGTVAGNYSTASGTPVIIDSSALVARVECSGGPVELSFYFQYSNNSTALDAEIGDVAFYMDGNRIGPTQSLQVVPIPDGYTGGIVYFTYQFTPAAGSHIFAPYYWLTGGGGALFLGGTSTNGPAVFTIKESVRVSANNGIS